MRKSIVLTGATGYIGSAVLKELISLNLFEKIIAAFHTRPLHGNYANVLGVPFDELCEDNFEFETVEVICHLGVPRQRINEPRLAQSLIELQSLLLKASKFGVNGFLYASSQAVYGQSMPPWRETTPVNPVSSHGWVKFAGEQLVESISSLSSAMYGASIRLPKIVGPGAGFRIDQGEWVNLLAYCAINNKTFVANRNFLSQQFDFMDVRDAASAVACVLARPPKTWPARLNIGTGRFLTGQELIDGVSLYCQNLLGRKLQCVFKESLASKRNFGMDVTVLNNYLEIRFQRAFLDMVADICSWILESKNSENKLQC